MKNLSILWFLCFTLNEVIIAKIEVTSGIYLESLPNISFYQSTRQIIFRVKRNQSILDKLNCRESFCKQYPHMCEPLSQKFDYFKNLHNNPSAIEENILLNDGELFDFQLATRNHLKKIFASDYEIRLLVDKFNKRDHITIREMNFPNLIANEDNVSCIDKSFKDLVRRDLEWQYRHSQMLVSMCQLKRLTLDFLPLDKLGRTLRDLTIDFMKNDYVLALGSLTQLYTMPLVECIMSPHTTLVGLHIPLLKRELQGLHVMKILAPAYAWENYTCSVNIPISTIALIQNQSMWKLFVPTCDPVREDLCYISDYRNEENLDISCVHQTLRGGSFKQFAINCPISCRETGNDIQFTTPLSSHRLVITHPTRTLRLKCRNSTYPITQNEKIGTLSLDVPCHCHLEDDEHSIYPTYSCVDKSITYGAHKQIPAAWTHYSGLSLPKWGEPPLYFDNLDDCLDPKWITYQFPDGQVPLTTYFLIILFILVFISLTLSTYQIYQSRTSFEHLIQRTSQRTFNRGPFPVIAHHTRQLPQPAVEHEYLEPREIHQPRPVPASPNPPSPPVISNYVPRPVEQASTSGTQSDSGYVKMDKLKAMYYAHHPTP